MCLQVTWSTTISLSGISASSVTKADEVIIVESLAKGSNDTDAGDLEIVSISDISGRRRRRRLASSGVDVVYTTTMILEDTQYTDAPSLFSSIVSDVEQSVTSGDFETTLIETATSAGSSSLASVTVDESAFVAPTTFSSTTLYLGGRADDTASKGPWYEEWGIVDWILSGIVAVFLIALLWIFIRRVGHLWDTSHKSPRVEEPLQRRREGDGHAVIELQKPQPQPQPGLPLARAVPTQLESRVETAPDTPAQTGDSGTDEEPPSLLSQAAGFFPAIFPSQQLVPVLHDLPPDTTTGTGTDLRGQT